ncbi:hypothetical protein CRYUN_Cryun01aG0136700 [Craigia yunnanensis]
MASLSAQILLCFALMVATCLMLGVSGSVEGGQREFDYFALSLQWPGTICHRTRHCCSSNACCRGSNSPTEFTIQKHGTCSSPVIRHEYSYFITTFNVYFKYNVTPRNCLASKTLCPKYVSLPAYVSMGRKESESDVAWISDDEAL